MEGPKGNGGEKHSADQNHSPNTPAAAGAGGDDVSAAAAAAVGRRPFTALSQEEADLALARVLQEQERAYMMLSAHGGDGSEYDASDAGSYDYYDEEEEGIEGDEGSDYEEEGDEDEEVGEAEGPELDPARYEDDEAYARALQDAEEREVAQRLMALAGITDLGEEMEHDVEDEEDGDSAQDAWEDVDPDEYSYEELVALGEVVGTESRGVSANTLASLPLVTYQAEDNQDSNMEQCVICRVEFEEGESLVALPCKHSYHSDCINQWLQLNKVCPMCSAEVSTPGNNEP
ncbi:E3 ubiquitin ligase BIG BROTHER-related [Aegilops tauschii subsp. strangulata]|uniref:RING-type domain-containing protein n=2 Tax=Triticinae TaxID=1648030 RepID=A0A453RQL8_AEGTS|nr:E3 ubiquitin ligase BIG BROTHER-related [Aegilops tauschii subsp. strangulata]XP_044437823.1 E3 ubiquitin ligase BIG BROTHER-related-like isoform X2 [Triticum aestivum]